jgi:hypothetical protein
MNNDEKVRENLSRRHAKRLDLVLIKSRARRWSVNNRQGYQIIDTHNRILVGEKLDLDLAQVEKFLDSHEAKARKGG